MPDTVRDKLIVALDSTDDKKIKDVVDKLYPRVNKFKVGLIPYVKFGTSIVEWLTEKGADVFLDLKFFDIPNTMNKAAKTVLESGIWSFTVHVRAGKEALRSLSGYLEKESFSSGIRKPLIFGVTELTSRSSSSLVPDLVRDAYESGLDGVVCSAWESAKVKEEFNLLTVTPGIRKVRVNDDQKRVATVAQALEQKSDYLVIGRPIMEAGDCLAEVESLFDLI